MKDSASRSQPLLAPKSATREAELSAATYPIEAVRIVARACYEAQWDESFDALNPLGIEYALAMQVGRAALAAMHFLASAFVVFRGRPAGAEADPEVAP